MTAERHAAKANNRGGAGHKDCAACLADDVQNAASAFFAVAVVKVNAVVDAHTHNQRDRHHIKKAKAHIKNDHQANHP